MTISSSNLDKVLDKVGSWYNFRIGSLNYTDRELGSITWNETGSAIGFLDDTQTFEVEEYGEMYTAEAVGYFKVGNTFLPEGSKVQVNHQGTWYEKKGSSSVPMVSGNQLLKQINFVKIHE